MMKPKSPKSTLSLKHYRFLNIKEDGTKVFKEPVSLDFMSKITNIKQENRDIEEEKDEEYEKVLNMHFEVENLLH